MKGLGYLISTASVLLLGIVAWPGPGEPAWKQWALLGGILASIIGMFVRYLSHRKDRLEIERAERMAERNS